MTDAPLRGFRLSSARHPPGRGPGPARRLIASLSGLSLALLVAVWWTLRPEPAPPPPTPIGRQPIVAPAPATRPPTATPTATETPTPEESSVLEFPTATPTPIPATSTPTAPPFRGPEPTPRPSECADVTWGYGQNGASFGSVLIQVDVTNRCNRDLEQLDIWFRATGWRDGAVVRSVLAHPLTTVRRNHGEVVSFDLPGSVDWYDRVTLEVLDRPP